MRNAKPTHTPGPWTHDETWNLIMGGAENVEIAAIYAAVQNRQRADPRAARANARLIAAAPDLLEVARNVLMDWEKHGDISDDELEATAVEARAAIAKAEGRTDAR